MSIRYHNHIRRISSMRKPQEDYHDILPHMLDYDWRFNPTTIQRVLKDYSFERVLLIGCPSLARTFMESGSQVTLVDRRPLLGLPIGIKLVQIDLRFDSIAKYDESEYDICIFDSPWYVDYIFDWLQEACDKVVRGGLIIFSVWPDNVRPNARAELDSIIKTCADIGFVKMIKDYFIYSMPHFEEQSLKGSAKCEDKEWRRGDLLEITIFNKDFLSRRVLRKNSSINNKIWYRYIFDDQQVALRIDPQVEDCAPRLYDLYSEDVIPSVSRRAENRSKIDLWTSANKAFRVLGANHFRSALDELIAGCDKNGALYTREASLLLYKYDIIRSSYYRQALKWQHLD